MHGDWPNQVHWLAAADVNMGVVLLRTHRILSALAANFAVMLSSLLGLVAHRGRWCTCVALRDLCLSSSHSGRPPGPPHLPSRPFPSLCALATSSQVVYGVFKCAGLHSFHQRVLHRGFLSLPRQLGLCVQRQSQARKAKMKEPLIENACLLFLFTSKRVVNSRLRWRCSES